MNTPELGGGPLPPEQCGGGILDDAVELGLLLLRDQYLREWNLIMADQINARLRNYRARKGEGK